MEAEGEGWDCYVVFYFLMFFFYKLCKLIIYTVKFGKELLTLLAVGSFCDYFIVFVCLSLWCLGSDADLIVSVFEFSYLIK